MATEKQSSEKVFGGNSLPAGTYAIKRAFIGEAELRITGQAPSKYDTLELVVSVVDANGNIGAEAFTTMRLNGVWRPRQDANGAKVQASGSLFDWLMAHCQGKSFTATRDEINAKLVNYKFTLAYNEYPSSSGGFGRVPKANFVQQPQAGVPV